MQACNLDLQTIEQNECLAESRRKINRNFNSLEDTVCELKKRVDLLVNVRTVFYYGPNGQTNSKSGMDNNQTTRPSNQTIEIFVNGRSELNLPAISFPNDIVYVIYQKTGYSTNAPGAPTANILSQTQTRRVISRVEQVPYYQDIVNQFTPIFIIWRLTYNGSQYLVDLGFPKFSQAMAQGSPNNILGIEPVNWNTPWYWSTF